MNCLAPLALRLECTGQVEQVDLPGNFVKEERCLLLTWI
jgi:hypothetical protein